MKKLQRMMGSAFVLSALLFLSGCVQTKNGVPTGDGWVWNLLVSPMSKMITFFAENQGLGFGLGIIIVTIIVRLFILPLGLYQSWNATYQSEKRNYLAPIFAPINERMRNSESQEEKIQAQQEMMAMQKEFGLSMLGGVGCLPLLIQMPFFTAIFYAARYTPGVDSAVLWGIPLGKPSLLFTAIVAVLYFIQSWMSMQGVDEEQRQQMKSMMYVSPLMIAFFSFSSPAGVSLYWVVGGVIQILQQVIINFGIRPYLRKKVAKEFEENPVDFKKYQTASGRTMKDVTPTAKTADQAIMEGRPKKNKNRNAGKQRSR